MRFRKTTRRLLLLSPFVIVPLLWGAAPGASQDGANEGFILFTSDRAQPEPRRYVQLQLRRHLRHASRRSARWHWRASASRTAAEPPTDPAAYNSGGADWSHSKKLIAFQSNRIARRATDSPDEPGRQRPAAPRQPLRAGPRFRASRKAATSSVSRPDSRRATSTSSNMHGTGMTNLTSPGQLPGQPGLNGDNIRCDWSPKGNAIAFTSDRDGTRTFT